MRNRFFRLILALGAFPVLVPAQEFRATVKGLVTDPSGAAVPASKVTATNTATNEAAATVSNTQGQYTIPLLRPGTYDIAAESAGFKKFVRQKVVLDVGQTATIDIALEVGGVSEQVTITSEAPLLDLAKADLGAVIDNQRVTEFALNGRNAVMLSRLVPGVAFTGVIYAQGTTSQGSIEDWAINGSQRRSSQFLLDGAPNDEKAYQNGIAYVPPADSVQEFKIQTNSYDAQYGRTGGGIVNVTVKSGTNSFHGTAYEYAQRAGWTANLFQNNSLGAPRDNTLFDQYGFEAEGPVYLPKIYNGRNRTFFMISAEFQRKETPHAVLDSVPAPEMLNGDFSKLVDAQNRAITVYDPTTGRDVGGVWTRDAFPGNSIPAARINPIARNILGYMPKPNTVTPGQGYSQLNYAVPGGQNPGLTPTQSVVGKLDQNFGDKHRVFFRRGWNNFLYHDSDNGIRTTGVLGDFGERKINDAYVLDWVYTPSPSLVFNARLAFNFFNDDVYVQENAGFDLTKLGFPASLNGQLPIANWFPFLQFSDYLTLGRDFLLDHTNNFSVQPNVSYFRGAHSLKAGADLRWIQHSLADAYNTAPFSLAADPGFTQRDYTRADALSGNSIASFLLGTPSGGAAYVTPFPIYLAPYYAPWVQDDWKVTRHLTLNLGFRWDFNLSPTERYNRLNRGFDAGAASPLDKLVNHTAFPDLPPLKGGLQFAAVNGASRRPLDVYRGGLQPRFGAAFALTNKIVLRGGWGRTYTNPPDSFLLNYGFSLTSPLVTSLDGGRTAAPNLLNNPFPSGVQAPAGARGGALTFAGQGFSAANTGFRTPHVDQFSFGLQYSLPLASRLEASYVGSRGYDLQDSRAINTFPLSLRQQCNLMEGGNPLYCDARLPNPFQGLEPFRGTSYYSSATLGRTQLQAPFPQFGSINQVMLNTSRSWYNSLQLAWETRRRGGLNLMASYTLSKQIEQAGFLDVQRGIPQRGLVDFDQPQRIAVAGIYELPFGRNKRFLGGSGRLVSRLVGGWESAVFFTYNSGLPWSLPANVLYMKDAALPVDWNKPIVQAVRPCIATWNDNGTITMQPFSVQNGCTDYNFLIAPRYAPRFTSLRDGRIRLQTAPQADISLNKSTQIGEKTRVQFRAEAFNATNTFLFYKQQFNNNPNSALFGTLTKAAVSRGNSNRPRAVQLGVKFIW